MTRINVVPVECLTDKHLLAEYKEITRPFNKVIKRMEKENTSNLSIPKTYVLGVGHETFFFDKLLWLWKRYAEVLYQLDNRGFNLDLDRFFTIQSDLKTRLANTDFWNDYTPTPEDMYLNMARLTKRSNLGKVLEEINNEQ